MGTLKELELQVVALALKLKLAEGRMQKAIKFSQDQISGFEEDRGLDSRWSEVVYILEGQSISNG